ncbi:MAG: family 43 glycosylhydrolase [Bacteroidales bacterium]|jgi:xylan 1,4-beta-xylosidase|nr:family 43 glycosylhydrolase [Bacteroidales bacterium]
MKNNIFKILIFFTLISQIKGYSQNDITYPNESKTSYCNPVDIDYSYMTHYAHKGVSYRSGADPAVINFKGNYYMFVTRSHGYWMSNDMSNWKFIQPQSWYFNGSNAPAAAVLGDKVIVLGDPSGIGAVIETSNPELGDWETNYCVIPFGIQDPGLFVDDDGKVYLYEGSSNTYPLLGVELDPDNCFLPKTEQKELIKLDPEIHGWERFGQNHNSDITPFIEGPWMSKHNGKYYLEYGAPGTQWNIYGDGVYISDYPLGPFEYAPYNPISYKPHGFINGAGHGSTVKDNNGNYWHYGTMVIGVNYYFERRIGLFPAGFENDGQMYVNTAYGDYPHFLPNTEVENHKERFTNWMLLSYKKPVKVSSFNQNVPMNVNESNETGYHLTKEKPDYSADMLNDENIRTYWVAENNDDQIEVEIDLEKIMTINAMQINFQEFNANTFTREASSAQQFIVEKSTDGKNWTVLVDYSENTKDVPHAYIELTQSVKARFLRFKNIHNPNKYLAISEFRIFGNGNGAKPKMPKNFKVINQSDARNADLSWDKVKNAQGYVVYWGISADKLNNSALIYDENLYALRALNKDIIYYFQVEAFNENGMSKRSKILKID